MASLKMYAIFDKKAEAFMQPFFFSSDGQACRVFQDIANDPSHMVARHPDDFSLYNVGSFDDNSGGVLALPQPIFIVNADALRKENNG